MKYQGFCWPNFVTGHFDLKGTKGSEFTAIYTEIVLKFGNIRTKSEFYSDFVPEIWVNKNL